MFKLGQTQKLEMVKRVEFGVYLADPAEENKEETVLLPKKQVPQDLNPGDEIEVFLYKDSKDRLIATTNAPKILLGGLALLRVQQTGKFGAFLDWGLEKDLFLPFKEQTFSVKEGDMCLVALYIDKSERLCATMKVYHLLNTQSPYQKDDKVKGVVYEISDDFGAFIAVDNQYSALIPKKELVKKLHIGEMVEARVASVKEDGKLDLSIREKSYLQMNTDAQVVLDKLNENQGVLPFNDKASPDKIREEMSMSKNEFKRAVGNLLKAGKIEIYPDKIVLK